jgi:hypothetical protein
MKEEYLGEFRGLKSYVSKDGDNMVITQKDHLGRITGQITMSPRQYIQFEKWLEELET